MMEHLPPDIQRKILSSVARTIDSDALVSWSQKVGYPEIGHTILQDRVRGTQTIQRIFHRRWHSVIGQAVTHILTAMGRYITQTSTKREILDALLARGFVDGHTLDQYDMMFVYKRCSCDVTVEFCIYEYEFVDMMSIAIVCGPTWHYVRCHQTIRTGLSDDPILTRWMTDTTWWNKRLYGIDKYLNMRTHAWTELLSPEVLD